MRESSLTFFEYAKMVATYNHSVGKGLMDQTLLDRGYSPEQIAALSSSNSKTLKSLNLILKPGFENLEFRNFNFYYNLFSQYEKGVLPYPGSLTDQPNKIIEVFNVFQSLNLEYEKRNRAEQEKKMKSKSRRK